jgi:predicted helicase
MATDHREKLAAIKRFDQLITYLRDEMGWPIEKDNFEELTFEYSADELGIDPKTAAKIESIKRLRPLSIRQPWGIFFVKFEPKKLPVMALRRILSQVALKKRASANSAERTAWAADDLLFVSNYGESDERRISFAHFSKAADGHDLPTLKVLGWDNLDTALHLDAVARELSEHLSWPEDDSDLEAWRCRWRAAFTLRNREVITTSKELSIRLAELARAIRDRIKSALAIETQRGPLTKLMKAFQASLVHDLDADGFADMYAQTIAYGLLTARVADPHKRTTDDFAGHMRTNPFLRELMETFLKVGGRHGKAGGPGIDYDELGVSEVVELLDDANMEAVVRDFGDKNPQEDPVIHFYELFLKEYDAKKRMQRGVFYTPRPVVSYIVRSVDELLRSEFGLEDGLADTTTWGEMANRNKDLKIPEDTLPDQVFVQILDPATGTGTFLVEVIDVIHNTLVSKWKVKGYGEKKIETLWNEYVPEHLLPRLHGYEILMAPYAIAHLKIGLKLYETGYRFGSDERARIYLTNTLESAHDYSGMFEFAIPVLAHEAQAVNEIKRRKRFTVVIGNPPYSAVSSNLTPELRCIIDPYRSVDGERIRERSMLQFEKNIQDDYVKFFAFSQARLDESSCGICSLITNHSYLDGPTLRGMRWNLVSHFQSGWFLDLHGNANKAEVAPEGIRDENVFDIRQGVAICALVKNPNQRSRVRINVGELWGERNAKYKHLSMLGLKQMNWTSIEVAPPYYYLVKPDVEDCGAEWRQWPAVCDLFTKRSTGTETGFDDLFVNFTKVELKNRLALFADPTASRHSLSDEFDFSDGHAATVFDRRKELHAIGDEEYGRFQLHAYDYRWVLLRKNLLKTNSFNVMLDLHKDALGLVTTRQTKERFSAFAVNTFCGHKVTSGYDRSYVLPLFTRGNGELLTQEFTCLDRTILAKFRVIAARDAFDPEAERQLSNDVFKYTIAVLNAPSYTDRFTQRLKRDWPKLPLPNSKRLFEDLARLGGQLVALHLLESSKLDHPITEFVGGRNPEVEKVSWSNNTVWVDKALTTGFNGIREDVWNFQIGGYQVCEKWLKDRKGRKLLKADIAHYQKIVVALSETILLVKQIDEVIEHQGGWPGAFQTALKTESQQDGLITAVPKGMHGGKV